MSVEKTVVCRWSISPSTGMIGLRVGGGSKSEGEEERERDGDQQLHRVFSNQSTSAM